MFHWCLLAVPIFCLLNLLIDHFDPEAPFILSANPAFNTFSTGTIFFFASDRRIWNCFVSSFCSVASKG